MGERRDNDDWRRLRAVVIVATYNERENIVQLCERILRQGQNLDVLVVDDNSPDGTGELVADLSARAPRVHLLRRKGKMGLGTAHVAGYRWALERGYDRVVTMDADFSHPPESIPALLQESCRCEVVLASRYVPGGGWEGWPARRVFLSSISNWVTRAGLRLTPKDCTGAFRCFRSDALRRIPFENIRARGFNFQEEMLWQCSGRGWRIGEVPIIFVDRQRGATKISWRECLAAVLTIARLMFTPRGMRKKA